MQSNGNSCVKQVVISKLVENINGKVEQKDQERNSQNGKIISRKVNLKRESFSKVVSEDVKGKNKSCTSEKKLMQRVVNWFFRSYYRHSKEYQGNSKIRN